MWFHHYSPSFITFHYQQIGRRGNFQETQFS